jgi:hypothetical protein
LTIDPQTAPDVLITALPDHPMDMISDVFAVIYETGQRSVRLVTGLPESTLRPTLGPLTRIIFQTTTVALARRAEVDRRMEGRTIRLTADVRLYRELLDRIIELGQSPSPPILVLEDPGPWRWSWSD